MAEVKTMPGFDGTGPRGQGPVTGRGMGPCCPQGQRRAFGRGGMGRGFGRRFADYGPSYYEPTKEEQKKILETELSETEKYLESIKKTLKEME